MTPLVFEESGFRIAPPDPAFRIAETAAYRALSGRRLKEMDVGWWETLPDGRHRLLLLEVKGIKVWQTPPDNPAKPHEHLVQTCVDKATDTLLMLAGKWTATTWGQELTKELPVEVSVYPGDAALKLVFLIDIPTRRRELLLAVREEINSRLSGRLGIFGKQSVSIIDFESAQKMGLPITRA
jgi:hypothetical protein